MVKPLILNGIINVINKLKLSEALDYNNLQTYVLFILIKYANLHLKVNCNHSKIRESSY